MGIDVVDELLDERGRLLGEVIRRARAPAGVRVVEDSLGGQGARRRGCCIASQSLVRRALPPLVVGPAACC